MVESTYRTRLLTELRQRAVRTDGPFTLASGAMSGYYVDARQVTYDGPGAWLVGRAVVAALDETVEAVGGMTMGADPIAFATALVAAAAHRPLRAFSIRKAAKDHGTGGRIVGPLRPGDRVAVLEDTTTTGSAIIAALDALAAEAEVSVVQAIALVDRSGGAVAERLADRGIRYDALATPAELGIG